MSEIRTEPRRLLNLNPRWQMTTDGVVYGISYDCPCGLPVWEPDKERPYGECCPAGGTACLPTKTNFAGAAPARHAREQGWEMTGTSFETLTLSPSVHLVGHWHGWIREGMVISC